MRKIQQPLISYQSKEQPKFINPLGLLFWLSISSLISSLGNCGGPPNKDNQVSPTSANTIQSQPNTQDARPSEFTNQDALTHQTTQTIDSSDWQSIHSSLGTAYRLGTQARFVHWSNSENGHEGNIMPIGVRADDQSCGQFRITMIRDKYSSSLGVEVTQLEYCGD